MVPHKAAPGYAARQHWRRIASLRTEQIGHKSEPCASALCSLLAAAAALQPAARKPTGGRLPTRALPRGAQAGRSTLTDATTHVCRANGSSARSRAPGERHRRVHRARRTKSAGRETRDVADVGRDVSAERERGVLRRLPVLRRREDEGGVERQRRRDVCPPGPSADFGRGPRPELVARAYSRAPAACRSSKHSGSAWSCAARRPGSRATRRPRASRRRSRRSTSSSGTTGGGAFLRLKLLHALDATSTHRYMVHHQAGPVFVQQPPQ